jgi:hypothetical protein
MNGAPLSDRLDNSVLHGAKYGVVGLSLSLVNRMPGRVKMIEAAEAARVILRGVERNQPT